MEILVAIIIFIILINLWSKIDPQNNNSKIKKSNPKKIKVNTKVAKRFIFEQIKSAFQLLNSDDIGRELINTFSMDRLIALNFLTIYISAENKWGKANTSRIINSMIKDMVSLYNNDSLITSYSHKSKLKDYYLEYKNLYSKGGKEAIFNNSFNSQNISANKNLKKYFKVNLQGAKHIIGYVAKY